MADKIPVKAIFTGPDVTALSEYDPTDTVPLLHGGTGATSAVTARAALDVPSNSTLTTHTTNTTNPHSVTAAQTGAYTQAQADAAIAAALLTIPVYVPEPTFMAIVPTATDISVGTVGSPVLITLQESVDFVNPKITLSGNTLTFSQTMKIELSYKIRFDNVGNGRQTLTTGIWDNGVLIQRSLSSNYMRNATDDKLTTSLPCLPLVVDITSSLVLQGYNDGSAGTSNLNVNQAYLSIRIVT